MTGSAASARRALTTFKADCEQLTEPHRTAALAHANAALDQLDAAVSWVDLEREARAQEAEQNG